MRTREKVATAAALALPIVAFLWLSAMRQPAKPAISIGVLGYARGAYITGNGRSMRLVNVGITNTGHRPISYLPLMFSGDAWVRAELKHGWVTNDDITPLGWVLSHQVRVLLLPGSNTVAAVLVPPDTLHWQVGYKVITPSARARVAARIPIVWRKSGLYRLFERILPSRENVRELQSDLFEWPHNEPPAPNRRPRPPLGDWPGIEAFARASPASPAAVGEARRSALH